MGVLADHQILERIRKQKYNKEIGAGGDYHNGLTVEPFEEKSPPGKISYGISSYGLDVRVGYKFKVFTPVYCGVIDPKNFDEKCFVDVDLTPYSAIKCEWCGGVGSIEQTIGNQLVSFDCKNCEGKGEWVPNNQPADHIMIPPNSFALAETLEYLEIPRDCICIVLGKSTMARCGIIVNVTPLEAEWKGKITMEISNTAPLPAKIYAGEGAAQILFLKGDEECVTSYADKKGIYQNQSGLTLPRIKQ